MSKTATATSKKEQVALNIDYGNGNSIDTYTQDKISDIHLYRVIVGVHDNYGNVRHVCYRKDLKHNFIIDTLSFDSVDELNDSKFIFTDDDFANLLNYLDNYDDSNLSSIARLGKKEIDPVSLLPIF